MIVELSSPRPSYYWLLLGLPVLQRWFVMVVVVVVVAAVVVVVAVAVAIFVVVAAAAPVVVVVIVNATGNGCSWFLKSLSMA